MKKGGKGDSPSDPQPKSSDVSGKGSGKGDSPAVPKAKAKANAGPAPMEVDPPVAQPKKTWVAIAVEGARPSAKAKMTPVPKAEPKGKAASVFEAKSAQAPGAELMSTDSRPGAAAREASGDDLHSALGRSSAKDAVAPLTASKTMAKKPEGSEVKLQSAERAAASPTEGHFLVLPENSVVDDVTR